MGQAASDAGLGAAVGSVVPGVGTLVGAGLGAATGLVGGVMANNQNADLARDQMAFQQSMSDTSYTRSVADLQNAGLNPLLAVGNGGASSPAGASATMVNPASGLQNTGLDVMKTAAQVAQVDAGLKQTASTIRVNDSQVVANLASAKAAAAKAQVDTGQAGVSEFEGKLGKAASSLIDRFTPSSSAVSKQRTNVPIDLKSGDSDEFMGERGVTPMPQLMQKLGY